MPHTVRDLNNYFLASENYQYVTPHSMLRQAPLCVACTAHAV